MVDHDEARATALAFVNRQVQNLPGSLALQHEGTATHLRGDAISQFEWRSTVGGKPGPRVLQVEIDRRSGGVVSFRDVAVDNDVATFTINRDEAVAIASARTQEPGSVSVESDIWRTGRWIVTIDRSPDSDGAADHEEIVIDAGTGEVISHARA